MRKRSVGPSRGQSERPEKKRLLFVRQTAGIGGSEIVILDLLNSIDYEKYTAILATPVDVFSKRLLDLKLPVMWVPLTAPATGGFFQCLFSWISCLRRWRPDQIILAEGGFRDFPLSTVLAASVVAGGNVWMMELHPAPEINSQTRGLRWGFIPRFGLRERTRAWLPKGILSVSQGVKDRLVRYGYPSDKIAVVYNGVDAKRFSVASRDTRSALRRSLQVPDQATVIVSAARLDGNKCLDRLIQAFAALSLEYDNLWLLLTGDGPLRAELTTLADSVDGRERIRFLGYVDDVSAVLRASDIYALPSNEEGFGIALVEAMACGLVCVATSTVGPSEIIENGRNGFLTDRTWSGVFKGLQQALELNGEERRIIGGRARQKVLEKFQVEEAAVKGLVFMGIDPAAGILCEMPDEPSNALP